MALLTINGNKYEVELELSKNNNFLDYDFKSTYTKEFEVNIKDGEELITVLNLNSNNAIPSKIPSTLELYSYVINGYCLIKSFEYDGMVASKMVLQFVADIDLFDKLKNNKLTDLDLTRWNFWYNELTAQELMRNRYLPGFPSPLVAMTMVDWSFRRAKKDRIWNTFHSSSDYIPVLKVKHLIYEIFSSHGYGVDFELDNDTQMILDRMVMNTVKMDERDNAVWYDLDATPPAPKTGGYYAIQHGSNFKNWNSFVVGLTSSNWVEYGVGTAPISFRVDSGTNANNVALRNTLGQIIVQGTTYSTLRWSLSDGVIYGGFNALSQKVYMNIFMDVPYLVSSVGTYSIPDIRVKAYKHKNGTTKLVSDQLIYSLSFGFPNSSNMNITRGNYFSYSVANTTSDIRLEGSLSFDFSQYYNNFNVQPLTHNYSGVDIVGEERVWFEVKATTSIVGTVSVGDRYNARLKGNTVLYNEVFNEYREGTVVDIKNDLCPDMTQSDYIKNILQLLNLKIDVDEAAKKIRIYDNNTYFNPTLDISDVFSVEKAKMEYTPNATFKSITFKPLELKNSVGAQYKLINNTNFGETKLNISDISYNSDKVLDVKFSYDVSGLVDNDYGYGMVLPFRAKDDPISIGLIGDTTLNSFNTTNLISASDSVKSWRTFIWLSGLATNESGTDFFYNYYPTMLPIGNALNPTFSVFITKPTTYTYPINDSYTTLYDKHAKKIYTLSNVGSRKMEVNIKITNRTDILNNIINSQYKSVYIKQLNSEWYVEEWIYSESTDILQLKLIKKI